MVLFDAPYYLEDTYVYGVLVNNKMIEKIIDRYDVFSNLQDVVQCYLEYIVGANKWLASGKEISSCGYFFIKDNRMHITSPFVLDFCKKAYMENPLKYRVIENINPKCSKKEMIDSFIISEEAYNRLRKEYGND